MKEEVAASSFDNLNCLQLKGNYMIVLILKKINCKFKKNIINYENIINFGHLECPHCNSLSLIRWGFYERGVIFFSDECILESKIIKIQRVKCKACGKTHALLPFGIIPYKQFSDEVISKVLLDRTVKSIDIVADTYKIEPSIIKSIEKQFKKYHLPKVSTITKCHNIKSMLDKFFKNTKNKINYIKRYSTVFMQIKSGILSLSPS